MAKTISRLANELGLKPDTIRYYERIGLLPEPERTAANYRQYDSDTLDRLRFIKGGQRLGLKLDEIRELLDIRDTGLCPCGQTATLLHNRIAALDRELERLTALREELGGMMERWSGGEQSAEERRWHCACEVIPLPDKLSDWLCGGLEGCEPAQDEKSRLHRGGENG